jgi:hypothetical protein
MKAKRSQVFVLVVEFWLSLWGVIALLPLPALMSQNLCLGSRIMVEKPLPREHKLSNITSDTVVADVVWPNAEPCSYELVVGLKTNEIPFERPCPDFAGIVKTTGPDETPVE